MLLLISLKAVQFLFSTKYYHVILSRTLLKKSCAVTHVVVKLDKISGKKLLTLTDAQLPINFLEHDAFIDTIIYLNTVYCFDWFKGILTTAMDVSNLDIFILKLNKCILVL